MNEHDDESWAMDDAEFDAQLMSRARRLLRVVDELNSVLGEPDRSTGVAVWSVPGPSDEEFAAMLDAQSLRREVDSAGGWSRARRQRHLRQMRRDRDQGLTPSETWFDDPDEIDDCHP